MRRTTFQSSIALMPTAKYLKSYAEYEAGQNFSHIEPASNCLVIPCRDEDLDLLSRINQLLASSPSTLVILVINQPESQTDSTINEKLAASALEQLASKVIVVDRFTQTKRIDDKQGVGLARKIGCDIACQLIHQGLISSPWIHTSDADVIWPDDYFSATDKLNDHAAAIYPFTHITQYETDGLPIALYELSLRYYVAGLHYAKSPYAYHTVGSTLVINAKNYAMVRGFPKRSAGEDFHILNKLRKTGGIVTLQSPVLGIIDRDSNRAPFGTGPAVAKLSVMDTPIDEYLFYHPQCFALLKNWLDLTPELFNLGTSKAAFSLLNSKLEPLLVSALIAAKIEPLITHCFKQAKTSDGFLKQLNDGFDALTTLRLIHYLRDHQYPSINANALCFQPSWFSSKLTDIYKQKPQLDLNLQSITLINQQLAR